MGQLRIRLKIGVIAFAIAIAGPAASAQAPPAGTAPSPTPTATPDPNAPPDVKAAAAILVNATDDWQILFARAGRVRRSPASLTKVVTALVARDEYRLDEVVTASPLVLQTHGSDLSLEPGMKITVSDLFYALLLKSANDAAMAIAAHHPAGYEHFIALMNEKARALGAYDSQFRNPHGLDQDGHYSTARDMAVFTRELLADPLLAAIVDLEEHTMTWKGRDRTFGTHNKLIRSHPEVIGIKTGFTNQAGHSLISGVRSPVGTLITVVMGSPDHYKETLALFDYGKRVSLREASGGGSVEGFGALPEPPSPPDEIAAGPINTSDPRNDVRWALLMFTLALLTAAMLVRRGTARRPRPVPATSVDRWLASLVAQPRRRR